MKTIIFFTFIYLLLLLQVPKNNEEVCPHCLYIQKFENGFVVNQEQPKPYIYPDTMFEFYPIIDNIDGPKESRYFNEFKLRYKDLHYCSDSTVLTLYLPNDSIKMWNIRPRVSCKIDMWYRLTKQQEELLKKYEVKEVKIENRVTDNIYRYKMTDPKYFTKIYDLLK
jgi:hypothetical protein